MSTFVLVHGAFHGGWCYSRVSAKLRAQMHDVYTPTLSGVGEKTHLASQSINLSTHIQDVAALIELHDLSDVILCGHSYGGMVITGVAGQLGERIKTLFYLDACVPENGQSLFDIIGPERTLLSIGSSGLTGTMMESPGAEFFQVGSENIEWVDKQCTPHPIACFIQKLSCAGKEVLVMRRTYVLCERYHSVNHATYARLKDVPGWKAVAVNCGHDVMISDPDVLATLLLEELTR